VLAHKLLACAWGEIQAARAPLQKNITAQYPLFWLTVDYLHSMGEKGNKKELKRNQGND
jgi:hypothetical protein